MTALYLLGILLQLAQLGGIYLLLSRKSARVAHPVAPVVEPEPEEEEFDIAARPPSWKVRRRQLRAAARTTRKKLEEWRD